MSLGEPEGGQTTPSSTSSERVGLGVELLELTEFPFKLGSALPERRGQAAATELKALEAAFSGTRTLHVVGSLDLLRFLGTAEDQLSHSLVSYQNFLGQCNLCQSFAGLNRLRLAELALADLRWLSCLQLD